MKPPAAVPGPSHDGGASAGPGLPPLTVAAVADLAGALEAAIAAVVVGKTDQVRLLLTAVFTGRHVLVDDVPGTGKTTLVKALARALGASFSRLQCTPDLLPTDVTGFYALDVRTGEVHLRPGPIFSQVLLVDEINRASPRTQSSLLECMEERQVSIDGQTHALPRPFLLLATQNPVEYEGTFPLPEAQLDRFGLRLHLGYPTPAEESALIERFTAGDPLEDLQPVTCPEHVLAAQETVRGVFVDPEVRRYAVDLAGATRRHPDVALGASPRCTLSLVSLAQAVAAMAGRDFVLPDDVKAAAPAAMTHRIFLQPNATWGRRTPEAVVAEVLERTRLPVAGRRGWRSRHAASD